MLRVRRNATFATSGVMVQDLLVVKRDRRLLGLLKKNPRHEVRIPDDIACVRCSREAQLNGFSGFGVLVPIGPRSPECPGGRFRWIHLPLDRGCVPPAGRLSTSHRILTHRRRGGAVLDIGSDPAPNDQHDLVSDGSADPGALLYALPQANDARRRYALVFYTCAYVAYLAHFYYGVFVHFGGIQGTVEGLRDRSQRSPSSSPAGGASIY